MKSRMPLNLKCLVLALSIISASVADASKARAEETWITFDSVLRFSAGIITAFSIHEAAHALVAELTDNDIDWEIGNYNQPLGFTEHGTSDTKGLALYSAGLFSQVVGSEIILQTGRIEKNGAFVRGMMAWNILNPILYSLDYWFIRRSNKESGLSYQGDIEGIEHYSSESVANGFALAITGIAVLQGYRFLKTQTWAPDWLKGKSCNLSFAPLPRAGMGIQIEFRF